MTAVRQVKVSHLYETHFPTNHVPLYCYVVGILCIGTHTIDVVLCESMLRAGDGAGWIGTPSPERRVGVARATLCILWCASVLG